MTSRLHRNIRAAADAEGYVCTTAVTEGIAEFQGTVQSFKSAGNKMTREFRLLRVHIGCRRRMRCHHLPCKVPVLSLSSLKQEDISISLPVQQTNSADDLA